MFETLRKFVKARALPAPRRLEEVDRELPSHPLEHARTTEKLRESEERFQVLIESIQDYAIYILDPNGFVISWNSGAQRIKAIARMKS